jgi:UDP-2-acetamido-2,6-beta-L-arabino-hexul-4-ose reductase
MRVLVTGARGFIGRNLVAHLELRPDLQVSAIAHDAASGALARAVAAADAVVHLAGVNRAADDESFDRGNRRSTADLCAAVTAAGRPIPVLLASSTQAGRDTPYGRSKLAAEEALHALERATRSPALVFRLPNVFGKWCRPDHNSVVATFCHKLTRGLPIRIDDPAAELALVHVDDVVERLIAALDGRRDAGPLQQVGPVERITVGELARTLTGYRDSRETLLLGQVGSGLGRALYSTYVSYLPPSAFAYPLRERRDARGAFVEVLRTAGSGQFAFLSAHPGATRGGHYHHTKTEKFLVVAGTARFRFHDILTGERHELTVDGSRPQVVETVPGWSHDLTNVGTDELLVLVWANENFEPARPDTHAREV